MSKNKCEYFDCNRKAKRIIETTLEKKPYIIHVCKKCFKEFEKWMNEED